jgi:hypothetical protein
MSDLPLDRTAYFNIVKLAIREIRKRVANKFKSKNKLFGAQARTVKIFELIKLTQNNR